MISYNLIDKSIKTIIGIDGASDFGFIDGNIAYIDDIPKTFTLFLLLGNGEKNIYRGKGVSKPSNDIIHSFEVVGDEIFYAQREPYGLYKVAESNDVLICEGEISSMTVKDDALYFILNGQAICMYDQYGNVSQLSMGSQMLYSSITVIHNFIMYDTLDGQMGYIDINS